MARASGVVISLVAVLWVSVPSLAQPADAPSAPPHTRQPWKERLDREPLPESKPEPVRSWYGWQTLLVDVLSVGATMLAVAATENLDGLWVGVALVAVGGPLVHFAHGNVTEGFSSLGMRALPTGLLAFAIVSNEERSHVLVGWIALFGAAIVMAVDAAVFAWDEKPPPKPPLTRLTPWLDPQHGRIGLAYAASF